MSLNDAKRESSSSQSRRAGSPDRRSLGRTSQTSPHDSTRRSTRRRSWALSATTMVETLISTAPTAGGSVMPAQAKRAGGERDRDDVVAGRPREVLHHLAVARAVRGGSRATTPRGSFEASTTPADSMATSVPAPMAMPTSARASAGASLTPSPTMATVRPRAWSSATLASLSSGRTSANTSSTPRSRADRVGDLAGVAGDHHDALDPSWRSCVDGLSCFGADLVLERERADDVVGSHEVEHRRAACAPPCRLVGCSSRGLVEPALAEQRGPADRVAAAVDGGLDAAAGDRPEVAAPTSWPRRCRRRRRWLGRAGARCRPRRRRRAAAPRRRRCPTPATPVTTCVALGERAGLVEEHGVDGAHPFEREPVLDEDARPGPRPRSTATIDERDGQAERVRAGDHEHGDRAHDRLVGVAERPTRRRR